MTPTLAFLLCMTLVSTVSPPGGDILVPGWRKVRCDITTDLQDFAATTDAWPDTDLVWIAEVGFNFGESTFTRLEGAAPEVPFHHYGATRLLAMPPATAKSFLSEQAGRSKNARGTPTSLPSGILSTPRLGGGYISVPEADATDHMRMWIKVSKGSDNALSTQTIRVEHYDKQGKIVRPDSGQFPILIAATVAIIGAFALYRFRRRACCPP